MDHANHSKSGFYLCGRQQPALSGVDFGILSIRKKDVRPSAKGDRA
jgi:hypothetical protein